MPLICTKVVVQIVQHDDRSINTKILENLIFTRYLRLTCVGNKSFLASPSQVTSHFVQVQVKSQVISLFNKSSHKSQKLRLESDSSPSHTTRVYNSATWIKNKEDDYVNNEQYEVADISSFSEMQRFVYDIVNTHFNSISSNREPLRLIIVGVAGTGKSYLINALRNLLQGKCTVTATTGKASYNIRAVTIHSLVKLPIGSRDKKELCRSKPLQIAR